MFERRVIPSCNDANSHQPENGDSFIVASLPGCAQVLLCALQITLPRMVKAKFEELIRCYRG